MKVSILLPTLNETQSFIETVKTILATCNPGDIEEFRVIICSRTTAESRAAIAQAGQWCQPYKIPFVVIDQQLPFAGGAVRDGITTAQGSHILMMAPDLETDPSNVCDFIAQAKKYPNDMITASRWLRKDSFRGYNPVKLFCNFWFQKIFSFLYGVHLTDITFGYRLAPAALLKKIKWQETKHPFFLETILKPIRLGVRIHEIPTRWRARVEGESQNSFWATFKYVPLACKVRFQRPKEMVLTNFPSEEMKNVC
jgi:glycosyltransferase involved in cell wall biosynthesis